MSDTPDTDRQAYSTSVSSEIVNALFARELQQDIADEYGMSQVAISQIKLNKTWKEEGYYLL